jgi:hypothetical protein
MRLFGSILVLVGLCAGSVLAESTTQPTDSKDTTKIQFEATQALNRGEFAVALPLLQKVADQLKDKPDQVGQVQEQIRVCQTNLKIAAQAQPQQPVTSTPIDTGPRKPHAAPKPGEELSMTIKELGNFDYDAEKGGNIPDDVKALSGSKIKVKGFMVPMDQADSITQFALVPSLFGCCYGQPPQIQHTIIVNCPKGKSVSYFPDEIEVSGKLDVEEKKDDGFIVSIFEIECSSVKSSGGK